MRFPPLARVVVALALVSAACSGSTQGGGGAARHDGATSTTSTTATEPTDDTFAASAGGTAEATRSTTPGAAPASSSVKGIGDTQRSPTSTTSAGGNGPPPVTATTLPPGLPAEKCPEAKTCRRYSHVDPTSPPARWPVVDGRAAIPYLVNPTACGLSNEDMLRAMEDASSPWERAAPTVDFTFTGFTDRAPVPGDGYSVVGCGAAAGAHAIPTTKHGVLREADTTFIANMKWRYAPCEQADNACTPVNGENGDIVSIGTHEFGHWLWLSDMTDQELDRELTMFPGGSYASRHRQTLALGDVLGVRSLYPCSCPLPPIYAP